MKKFIANNWKKILIVITAICIIINLGIKIIQKPNVIPGYIENGPVVESDVIDNITDATGEVADKVEDNPNDIEGEPAEEKGTDKKLFKIMVILIVALGGIFLFSALFEKDDKADKKKK